MADTKTGKFVQISSNNFEQLLKQLGVPDDQVAKWSGAKHTIEMSKTGDEVHIMSTNGDHVRDTKFKLGVKYSEKFNGKDVQAIGVKEGNRITHTIGEGDKQLKVVYEWNGNELRVTSTAGPVVAVRTYAKQ
ncbi:unnamed protein product [Medioppia subpectinata]|uniref:Uncharacterized protein n=1 Tax=Medioppia subpectinata TaxID=1979941 RepID=A0A7R9KZI5_9ACAR|nr:unnamed protein product [Medioppia subpectinata]CAG2112794.1 unnamed protein product [Medioppia subpectinata]